MQRIATLEVRHEESEDMQNNNDIPGVDSVRGRQGSSFYLDNLLLLLNNIGITNVDEFELDRKSNLWLGRAHRVGEEAVRRFERVNTNPQALIAYNR